MLTPRSCRALFCALISVYAALAADITPPDLRHPSKHSEPAVPAAFADVNGDRFTDVILVSSDGRRLLILLGHRDDPVLTYADPVECPWQEGEERIRSVVPGDFDGDETIDIFVTTDTGSKSADGTSLSRLLTFWGKGGAHFECPTGNGNNETAIVFQDEPLAMDYNGDLIPDLFAIDENGTSVVWMWDNARRPSMKEAFSIPQFALRAPHSNAFVDIDGDHHSDLVLTGTKGLHVFPTKHGRHNYSIPWPEEVDVDSIGQTAYVDADADGNIDLIVPACTCERPSRLSGKRECLRCSDSRIYVRPGGSEDGEWHRIDLTRENATDWVFALEKDGKAGQYLETVSIRFGDYDLDGYPDFLASMRNVETGEYRVVLFRNEAAAPGSPYPRSFSVDLYTFHRDNTIMGAFFDLRENGLLDVILLQKPGRDRDDYRLVLFENDRPVGYDHYFLKVVVFGPRRGNPLEIGEDLSSAATNVAGACVSFVLDDFVGAQKTGKAVQQSQTAHYALQMPYVIFGLADVSNFVETLTVGLPVDQNVTAHRRELSRSWFQVIPNSQVYVTPSPLENPKEWKIKLFLTPKHMIGRTLLMLWSLGFAALIIVIIIYWREKILDKREKRKEAYMMYFSALRG